MIVQLEYIYHLLKFFKNIFYYAGIMFNVFRDLLCSKLYWHNQLVPIHGTILNRPAAHSAYIASLVIMSD